MEVAKRIAFFCIIVSFFAVAATALADELTVRHPAQDELGKSVTCSVMNTQFEVTKDTPVIDYKGNSYYFCCAGCVDMFKKDPDKYAKKMDKPAN